MVKFLIERPIAVTVTLIAFIVMSLAAAGLIPVSLMPEVDIPEIVVQMNVQGKPAREMEEQFVSKVRRQLLQVSHLNDVESIASNGQGNIRLVFNYGTNINYAFIEVNEKIDALMHTLPAEFQRPRVIKTSATDIPVFYLNVSLKDSLDEQRFMELSEFCEQVIKKRVEQLPEVALADISGLEYPEIVLQADMERLAQLGIDRSTFTNALETNNYTLGNIKVRDGLYEFNVRYSSLLKNRSDIENLFIHINNRVFRLKDLAAITVRPEPDKGIYLSDNTRSVVMAVIKKSGARMASLKENTGNLVNLLQADYPRLNISIERNQTELLDYSLGNLKSGLLAGGLLAFFIMFLFLKDLKSPLLIGISVPVSLAISLLFFYITGISINIISLSGLILGVGMMIDNSIIVIDNIIQHYERNKNEETTINDLQTTKNVASSSSLSTACISGTNEVIRPLISSVLTTCAVFVPLVFLSGISGALFYDQAMAVAIGLGVSLLVSFTLIPVYFRLIYRNKKKYNAPGRSGNWLKKIHLYNHIENSYDKGFDFVFKYHVLFFILAFLVISSGVYVFINIRKEKFPAFKQTEVLFNIDWNRNISVAENHRRMNAFLSQTHSLTETSSCLIGKQDFLLDASGTQGAPETQLYIKAYDEAGLSEVTNQFSDYCRTNYSEAVATLLPPPTIFEKVFNSRSAPLEIRLMNRNGNGLPAPSTVQEIVLNVAHQADIQPNNQLQLQDFYSIVPDYERMLLYDVRVDEVISVLKKALNQLQVFTLKQGQYQVPVFLSGQEKSLHQIVRTTTVTSENRQQVPLVSLVDIQEDIDYKNLQGGKSDIFISLGYDVSSHEAREVVSAYNKVLESWPQLEMEVRGSLAENVILFKEMGMILLVSLLLLYFILAAQFESLLQPLIVLIEIPIDIAAAILILYVTGNSLNLMAFIGIIVMSGIIINDSILKIDTINRLVKTKVPVLEAIHLGGRRRLKPILMTSATTILAMIPFLFGNDMGSRLQQPLAITVISGMFIGTLVSLYFIPLIYYYMYRMNR